MVGDLYRLGSKTRLVRRMQAATPPLVEIWRLKWQGAFYIVCCDTDCNSIFLGNPRVVVFNREHGPRRNAAAAVTRWRTTIIAAEMRARTE